MSKERLEEIIRKEAYLEGTNDLVMVINKDDYRWLIKQAERVEDLENENRILRTVAESNKYIGEQYLEQNKRYREAIERALDESGWGDEGNALYRTIGILTKALEESK